MGQTDVLNFLEQEYIKDPHKWFSIDDVKLSLNKANGFTGNVWQQVNKLCAYEQVYTRLERLPNCRWGYRRMIKHKEDTVTSIS